MVAWRRSQVLGDGDDVAAGGVEVDKCGADLLDGLAHTEDQIALGNQTEFARRGQHIETALVTKRRTDPFEDPRNRFEVVCQHFWPRFEDLAQQFGLAVEVRD